MIQSGPGVCMYPWIATIVPHELLGAGMAVHVPYTIPLGPVSSLPTSTSIIINDSMQVVRD